MNLYENLASQLKDAIRQGIYPPGDRVPSVRRLSSQHRVSQATVVAAYRLLESHGWLEARPQSGFFARHPESAPPAAACSTCWTLRMQRAALQACRCMAWPPSAWT